MRRSQVGCSCRTFDSACRSSTSASRGRPLAIPPAGSTASFARRPVSAVCPIGAPRALPSPSPHKHPPPSGTRCRQRGAAGQPEGDPRSLGHDRERPWCDRLRQRRKRAHRQRRCDRRCNHPPSPQSAGPRSPVPRRTPPGAVQLGRPGAPEPRTHASFWSLRLKQLLGRMGGRRRRGVVGSMEHADESVESCDRIVRQRSGRVWPHAAIQRGHGDRCLGGQ
jgi:hypothetical protein